MTLPFRTFQIKAAHAGGVLQCLVNNYSGQDRSYSFTWLILIPNFQRLHLRRGVEAAPQVEQSVGAIGTPRLGYLTQQIGRQANQGVLIDLALTRQDVAEMAGTTLLMIMSNMQLTIEWCLSHLSL